MTKYEKKIFEIVNASRDHLTAEQVLAALREEYPAVSQATVYNNLKKLTSDGLLRKLTLADSPDRYDRIQRHDHLICQRCGRLADMSFEDMTEALSAQLGCDILSYDLKVSYVCLECRAAAENHDVY